MDEQERLYALALSLVPDADVAGDLFMDARNEADLRRRAGRWLRRNGLPVPAPDLPVARLTPDQQEYAAHLSRRGRHRRLMLRTLAGALCMAAAFYLFVDIRAVVQGAPAIAAVARPGLAADEAFQGKPLTSARSGGLDFVIYRADATPGSVTVWWAMQGRDAVRQSADIYLAVQSYWANAVTPTTTVVDSTRPDRLLGRSTFRLPLLDATSLMVTANRTGAPEADWKAAVKVDPRLDPTARMIPVNQSFTAMDGAVSVQVTSVTVAPDYTLVHYKPEGMDFLTTLGHIMAVQIGDTPLERYGVWRRYGVAEERDVVLSPVPAGAASLAISFPRLARREYSDLEYPLPAPDTVQQWQREGGTLRATIALPANVIPAEAWAEVIDRSGRHYSLSGGYVRFGDQPGLSLLGVGLPSDADLVTLLLHRVGQDVDVPTVNVDLSR